MIPRGAMQMILGVFTGRSMRLPAWALWLVPLFQLGAVASLPAAPTFDVKASLEPKDQVTDTDPVRLVIRIQGGEQPDISVPRLPTFTNLRVISGPSTYNEFTWTNGRASASATMTYVLLAEHPGPAEVPSIDIRVGSTIYRTDPIQVRVVKGQTGPKTGQPPGGAPKAPAQTGAPDVFLRAQLSSGEAWVGQPVTLSVILYSTVEITNLQWRQLPTFSSFWTEEVSVDPNAERFTATVGGRTYRAFPLEKRILMATAPGNLTIEPYAAEFQARVRSRDVFSDFFSWGRIQNVIRKTDPLTLHVRRLPEAGRPVDFGGAVGSFRMRASLDRGEVQVNEAVALKVTVEGEGFLKSVSAPRLDAPPDLKVFDPKVTETSQASGGKVLSKKTWEWVLVPLVPGEVRVPAPTFSFFDPSQEIYRELRSDPLRIAVRRVERGEEPAAVARGEVRLQRHEIAFIKPLRGRLAEQRPRIHERPLFLALLLLPLAWVPAVIVVGRRQVRLRQDRGLIRGGRARGKARKRLRTTERRMAHLDTGNFHEEVARVLVEYIADRFDRSPAGLTYEVVDQLLESRGVDPVLRGRFRSCLERCDFARFVPDSGQASREAEVLREAAELVDRVEKAL